MKYASTTFRTDAQAFKRFEQSIPMQFRSGERQEDVRSAQLSDHCKEVLTSVLPVVNRVGNSAHERQVPVQHFLSGKQVCDCVRPERHGLLGYVEPHHFRGHVQHVFWRHSASVRASNLAASFDEWRWPRSRDRARNPKVYGGKRKLLGVLVEEERDRNLVLSRSNVQAVSVVHEFPNVLFASHSDVVVH
ncbi:unnamed protein product [Ixodes hexagonus]